jgi:SAM-dependent methyltransferase
MQSLQRQIHGMGNDYSFKTPRLFQQLALAGILFLLAYGLLFVGILLSGSTPPSRETTTLVIVISVGLMLPTLITQLVSLRLTDTRMNIRDRIAAEVTWRGDEQVLDVGTGSGISLFACAKHLTTDKGIGIDIYDVNAGGGTEDIFWKNADMEGVRGRVEMMPVDARKMPFEDNRFDVIISTFAMHHIQGVETAVQEMVRTLKPGGKILIKDVGYALQTVEQTLRAAGFTVRKEGSKVPLLIAQKPR